MKLLLFLTLLFTLSGCTTKIKLDEAKPDYSASFNDVWNQVKSDPIDELPQTEVSFLKLSNSKENLILKDSQRTLNDHSDLLDSFEKLAHPNGICFKGIWEIDVENIYGGYFQQGKKALIIARASSAMSNTQSGSTRAFGFAGKLFPTMDPNKIHTKPSGNFFLIDDLGGTDANYYRDVALTNEPTVSITFEVIKNMFYAIEVAHTFSQVDENPSIRQLYEISYLGEDTNENIITPKWLKIEIENTQTADAKDFRDELKIEDGETLVFSISVANRAINSKKVWQKIGTIQLDTSIVSKSCDQNLHFHHPKWRSNLDYGIKEN